MSKLPLPSSCSLESIFQKSQRLKLPTACYYQIKDRRDAIPYTLCTETLDKYGIYIFTLSYQDNSVTFKQIIQNLGILHTHTEADNFLWDIKISRKNKNANYLARSNTDHEFHFHTDCSYEENVPDYLALYVLHADQKSGGKNLVVDVKCLIETLSQDSLTVLQNTPITIRVPQEFFKGIDSIQACIMDKNFNIRYRREIIDFKNLTPKQLKAIEELESLVYSPQWCRGIILSNNQILILSNKRFLHARTQIKDPKRHLQRIRFFLPSFTSFVDSESSKNLLL